MKTYSQLIQTPYPTCCDMPYWTGFSKWWLCSYDVELGNQGNETQIFAFEETIDILSVLMSFYWEYAIYSISGSLGTYIMPQWNKLTFYASIDCNCVCCWKAAGTRELDHFSSTTETHLCGLADCCNPLWAHVRPGESWGNSWLS